MDLSKWLKETGIGQRELSRRVGYKSNGPLSKIIKGEAYVPPDQIPEWADALELKDTKRVKFIDECLKAALPDWHLAQIRKLKRVVGLFIEAFDIPDARKRGLLQLVERDLGLIPEGDLGARVEAILTGMLDEELRQQL